ncbi:hypothetical protein WAI453_009581 [Rhynchosporium graminicola]
MALECPTCRNEYSDILDHIRKKHATEAYSALQLQPIGLTPCPICSTACRGAHGVKTHSAKVHGIIGNSKVSTQHRIHTTGPLIAPTSLEEIASGPEDPEEPAEAYRSYAEVASTIAPTARKFSPRIAKATRPYPPALAALENTLRGQLGVYKSAPGASTPRNDAPGGKRTAKTPSPGVERPTTRRRRASIVLQEPVIIDSSSESDLYAVSEPSPTPSFEDALEDTAIQATPSPKETSEPLRQRSESLFPSPATLITPRLPLPIPTPSTPTTQGRKKRTVAPVDPVETNQTLEPGTLDPGPDTAPRTSVQRTGLITATAPRTARPSITRLPSGAQEQRIGPTATTAPSTSRPSTTRLPSGAQAQRTGPIAATAPSSSRPAITRLPSIAQPTTGDDSLAEELAEHQAAIRVSLEKPAVQTLLAYSVIQVPEKRLHARQAILFTEAAQRAATAFLKQPREKQLLDFLLLPRVLGVGLQKNDVAKTLKAYPTTLPELPETSTDPPVVSNDSAAKRAVKLLEKGFIGRASRALIDPIPLAPDTPETLKTLLSKHPIGHENPFSNANPAPGQNISPEAIQKAIRSIDREKACELSGWTRPLLDIAVNIGPTSPVVKALAHLANMIRQGTAPGVDLLCASRLIGLQKPDGGVRPIAIGDLIYKVALKAILATSFRPSMLLPNQLGVGSIGGVEPIIFLLDDAITGPNRLKTQQIASLDLVNAYNRIGRCAIASAVAKYAPTLYRTAKWAYNQPSILVTNKGQTLASAEGVRQGDPIAPLLFSLAIRPMLEHLQKTLPRATIIAYLDDIYICSPDSTALLPVVTEAFQHSPVALNRRKSADYPIAQLQAKGLQALGTYIGPVETRRTFLRGKITTLAIALDTLKQLPKQHALLLLRGSIHLLLRHLQRQLYPEGLEVLWKQADSQIHHAIQALIAREPGDQSALVRSALIALPVREGGLGIPIHALLAPGLYRAAKEASRPILEAICPKIYLINPEPLDRSISTAREVFQSVNQGLESRLLLTLPKPALKTKLENASYLGRYWLRTLPTQKHYLLADSTVTEALRTRLLLPVKPPIAPCTACSAYPEIGHEDTCRGAQRRWIIRHDQVTRAFITTLSSREDLKVESEPTPATTGSRQPENSKRPDFSVLIGTSRHYYDVQIVAINKDSAREEAYATLTEAANAKQLKYKDLGPVFHPLIISAGGLMEKDTAKTYRALQGLLGPSRARWLDSFIATSLTQARGIAATSIIAYK